MVAPHEVDRGPASARRTGRRGDHDAFAELVDPSLARLDAAARLILRDAELARDAVQETMVRAWRDLPGFAIRTGSTPGSTA